MNELARRWIRRIASGLPIGAAVLASGCYCSSNCSTPDYYTRFVVDQTTADQITAAAHDPYMCSPICRGLESQAADGGLVMLDAGDPPFGRDGLVEDCSVASEGGTLIAECQWQAICGGGRRPAGLFAARLSACDEAGAWLARMAWMEAASVFAFEELAVDLARCGAPSTLIAAARRAANEERRHAHAVGVLARARGATPPPVVRSPVRARPLADIACENAAEGCVRETFGALVAAHQAAHAQDLDVRLAMASIAREEATHALLSDAIDRWARTRIDPQLLDGSRAIAAASVRRSEDEVTRPTALALGLPDRAARAHLAAAIS